MVRAGLVGEVSTAVQHGTDVAQRILGNGPAAASLDVSTAYPINGAVDAPYPGGMRAAGLGTAVLAETPSSRPGRAGRRWWTPPTVTSPIRPPRQQFRR